MFQFSFSDLLYKISNDFYEMIRIIVSFIPRSVTFNLRLLIYVSNYFQGTAIQGFIPAGRVGTFKLIAGSVYELTNFFGSRNKEQYPVADHIAIVTFTWNTDLSVLDDPPVRIPEDRFRFRSLDEFRANCDSKGGLYGKSCRSIVCALS